MEALRIPLFAVSLAAEAVLGIALAISILRPEARIWPPPGRPSWQFSLVWIPMIIATAGIFGVGLLDWNTFVLAHPARIPLGAAIALAGGLFALWGIRTLSWHQALGLKGRFVESGPYRISRNPQYVGDTALLIGWGLACSSLLTWILCALGVAWFALAPLAEEPWLRDQYGPPFEAYRRRVPRFLGRPRMDRAPSWG